jgi:predicted N-acetyltransferase YhbS
MKVTVRFAAASDVERLAGLSNQLGYPTTPAEIAERLAQIQTDEEQAVFVAESASREVIGWIHVFLSKLLIKAWSAEIGGLIVDAQYQGQGIGSLLVARAEAWGREKGAAAVSVRSSITREQAHDFYSKLGYEQVRTQHVFRKML